MKIQIPITTIVGAKITLSTLLLCIPISSVAELNVNNNGNAISKGQGNTYKPTDQSNNNVTISGNEPQGAEIYGGYSDSEETKSNTINVDPGTFIGNLYPNNQKNGGKVIGGKGTSSSNNKVEIKSSNTNFVTKIAGGMKNAELIGGYATTSESKNNTVLIDNKTVFYGGYGQEFAAQYLKSNIYGGQSKSTATSNKVEIKKDIELTATSDNQHQFKIAGGFVEAPNKNNGKAISSNNSVIITDAKLTAGLRFGNKLQHHTHIIGGEASVFWNFDYGSAEAIGNMVNLTNVTIATHSSLKNPIIDIFGGLSKDATTDNVVTIKGNTKINWDGSGSASSTKIYIKGGNGYHQSNRNKVYIQDNSKIKAVEIIGGGRSQVASENLVIISGGTINVPTIGGGSATNATNNQVTISGGKVTSSTIYGGNANKSANENKVTITEGTANIADIYGGKSISNNSIANKNSITISGGTLQVTNIYGGHSAKDANENSIQISNGGNINNIVGGHAQDHTNLNTINITGGTIQSVTGGNSGVVASQNYVNVSGGVVENYIIGGKSYSGSATKNSVIVSTDTSAIIIGGQGTNANAIENSVTISGGKVTNSIYGGKSTNGNANKNSVTISGDNTSITDKIYGGEGISASENRIEISNGKISGEIYGGYGTTVSKNSVTISGGTVTSNIYGGKSLNGNSTENSVNISNGTITGNIYGGYAKVASKNVVAISGGTIVGNIYGGYSSGGGSSTGNKIIISGSPDLSNATLYGADGKIAAPPPIEQNLAPKRVRRALADPADIQPLNDPPSDYKSGNTLATQDSLNLKIKSIKNFSNLNLNIPRDMTTNDYILILGEDMDLSDLIITPQFNANNLNLNEGDTITLIGGFDDAKITGGDDANSIIPIPIPAPQPAPIPVIPAPAVPIVTPIIDPVIPAPIIPAPVVLVSEPKKTLFGVSQIITYTSVGNSKFVLGKKEPNPGMKSFLESGVASIVSTNQAGDLASNEGIKNMVSQASSSNSFAALSNGRFRYKTGSHIDINGFSLIVGVSKEIESFTYGIFMEAGNANYNSYNDFAPNSIPNTNSIKGSGDTNYFGIGVLLNTKLANNFYLDGSLRGGKVKSNYVSNDFNGVASFDMGRNYFGGHIGLGRIFNINDINIIDLYSKILYSEQGSKAVYIRDEGFEFDTAKSIRLSLGARYNYELNDSTNLYGGAAYEREFDGKQKTYSIVANANIDAPGASGDSAMLEIGASITPTNYKAFNANFNLQLFTGVKSGISGGLKARYKF